MKNNFQIPFLYNPGVLSGKLPQNIFDELKIKILNEDAKKIKYNQHLVGSIKEEYVTPKIPSLIEYISEMYETWVDLYRTPKVPYVIDNMWTNYMNKGEFNPNHTHPNALAVFVIWIKIPYDLNEEMKFHDYRNADNSSKNSLFEFTYNTLDGRIVNFPLFIDKSFEGTVILFPSRMMHCVYPFFTSNEQRVSIAGNIYEKPN